MVTLPSPLRDPFLAWSAGHAHGLRCALGTHASTFPSLHPLPQAAGCGSSTRALLDPALAARNEIKCTTEHAINNDSTDLLRFYNRFYDYKNFKNLV